MLGSVLLCAFWLYQILDERDQAPAKEAQSSQSPALAFEKKPFHDESAFPIAEGNPFDHFPSAIPQESTVVFDSNPELQAFLDAAQKSGLEIVAIIKPLNAARIRYTSAAAEKRLQQLAPNAEPNYTLIAPIPVAALPGYGSQAFENSALAFIGAATDQSNWGAGITVAVLDSDILPHTSLDAVEVLNAIEERSPSETVNPHGTAVASLIAGKDGVGVAPFAQLLNYPVLDGDGVGDTFSLAESIVAATDAGADIINLSVASYGNNRALASAVAYAQSNGVVLVAAAGNETAAVLPFPAAYESVIAVSAVDANGHPTPFANQHEAIDVSAPGVDVIAAGYDDEWQRFSGTSAATAFVSGAVAAVASQNPTLTTSQAAELLIAHANDSGLPGRDPQLGNGSIDLQRSLRSSESYDDLALADIYLDPSSENHGEQTVHLSIQNRGTQPIPTANLEFTLPNHVTQSIYLGSLEPGQSGSYSLKVADSDLMGPLPFIIEARAYSGLSMEDEVPENDSMRQSFQLILPEEE